MLARVVMNIVPIVIINKEIKSKPLDNFRKIFDRYIA